MLVLKMSQLQLNKITHYVAGKAKKIYRVVLPDKPAVIVVDKRYDVENEYAYVFLKLNGAEVTIDEALREKVFVFYEPGNRLPF